MDISPYVDRLRQDLASSAAAGDSQIQAAGERLVLALDPSMRLALMEVLSQAAAEITSEMRAGSVDVRLVGRDLEFVVEDGVAAAPAAAPSGPADEDDESDAATARITLRLPESVKTRAEELAAKHGSSLNTWIVNVLRGATRDGAINIDIDLSSIPFAGDGFTGKNRVNKRQTGWV